MRKHSLKYLCSKVFLSIQKIETPLETQLAVKVCFSDKFSVFHKAISEPSASCHGRWWNLIWKLMYKPSQSLIHATNLWYLRCTKINFMNHVILEIIWKSEDFIEEYWYTRLWASQLQITMFPLNINWIQCCDHLLESRRF